MDDFFPSFHSFIVWLYGLFTVLMCDTLRYTRVCVCVCVFYPVSSGMSWSASTADNSTSASALLSLPGADRPHRDSGLTLSPLQNTHGWFSVTWLIYLILS